MIRDRERAFGLNMVSFERLNQDQKLTQSLGPTGATSIMRCFLEMVLSLTEKAPFTGVSSSHL